MTLQRTPEKWADAAIRSGLVKNAEKEEALKLSTGAKIALILDKQNADGGWKNAQEGYGSTNDDGLTPKCTLALMEHFQYQNKAVVNALDFIKGSRTLRIGSGDPVRPYSIGGLFRMSPTQPQSDPAHPFRYLPTQQDGIFKMCMWALFRADEKGYKHLTTSISEGLDGMLRLIMIPENNWAVPQQCTTRGTPEWGRIYEPPAYDTLAICDAISVFEWGQEKNWDGINWGYFKTPLINTLSLSRHKDFPNAWPRLFMWQQPEELRLPKTATQVFGLTNGGYTFDPTDRNIKEGYAWYTSIPNKYFNP